MNQEEYYTAPSDAVFEGIKTASIKLWQTYDDQFGYATDKVNMIKNIKNIKDNTCHMVAMFDSKNHGKLLQMVEGEAKAWLEDLLFNNQT
jgi:hypothetical protein